MEDINQTRKDIEHGAAEAVKVIANAAQEAAKVVANATAEALKVSNIKTGNDHDLLIELRTRMEGLKYDIQEIKSGTATQLSEHEIRINKLETSKSTTNTLLSIGIGLLSLLSGLMTYHMIK